jgi:DNA invertase Pin-like site-specific DNA recombinase
MKIGYARVSTDDQKMDLQRDALTAAGCEKVFTAKAERPGLADALAFARKGDSLVVWRLDRLGRSLPELVKIVAELEAAGVGFESTTERIETSTATGGSGQNMGVMRRVFCLRRSADHRELRPL